MGGGQLDALGLLSLYEEPRGAHLNTRRSASEVRFPIEAGWVALTGSWLPWVRHTKVKVLERRLGLGSLVEEDTRPPQDPGPHPLGVAQLGGVDAHF